MTTKRTWRDVLRYRPSKHRSSIRSWYKEYRREAGLPERCDNPNCAFHVAPLIWNGNTLPLIVDHIDGVRHNSRPDNLRYLCPNCDSQLTTRGGANIGHVADVSEGGYAVRDKATGLRHFRMPVDGGVVVITGGSVGSDGDQTD